MRFTCHRDSRLRGNDGKGAGMTTRRGNVYGFGNNKMLKNKIHIMTGKYKRKSISFVDLADLRPTGARVRKTLFDWLRYDIYGKVCLDLFAGSGVLGFEAISNGAKELYMVENNYKVYQNLKRNSDEFVEDIHVINKDSIQFVKNNDKVFDMVFFDPPFNGDIYLELDWFLNVIPMSSGAYVYVELSAGTKLPTVTNFEIKRAKRYSMVEFYLLEKKYE
jgi:16S rRNA (guanine966-N2)-methyltransferase